MFKLLLIWRYFIRRRITIVAVTAVALLVTLVLVVLSVMSGLLVQQQQKNHQWAGDVILTRDSLVGFDHYEDFIEILTEERLAVVACPILKGYALGPHDQPIKVFGLKFPQFARITSFGQCLQLQTQSPSPTFIIPDSLANSDYLKLTNEQKKRGCFTGHYIIDGSTCYPGMEWPLTVPGVDYRGLPAGPQAGSHQMFWNVDGFRSGLIDVDVAVCIDFDELQKLSWMAGQDGYPRRASEIRVKLPAGIDLQTGRQAIARRFKQFVAEKETVGQAKLLKDVKVLDWKEYRRAVIAPIEKEKNLMILIFGMVGFVALFIILAIFHMIVTQKTRDLGIVKATGCSQWGLAQIFLGFGALVGFIGAALGSLFGMLIVVNAVSIEAFLIKCKILVGQIWDPDIYPIDQIPDSVDAQQAVVIFIVAVVASILGSAIPAVQAARLNVVSALRVE